MENSDHVWITCSTQELQWRKVLIWTTCFKKSRGVVPTRMLARWQVCAGGFTKEWWDLRQSQWGMMDLKSTLVGRGWWGYSRHFRDRVVEDLVFDFGSWKWRGGMGPDWIFFFGSGLHDWVDYDDLLWDKKHKRTKNLCILGQKMSSMLARLCLRSLWGN